MPDCPMHITNLPADSQGYGVPSREGAVYMLAENQTNVMDYDHELKAMKQGVGSTCPHVFYIFTTATNRCLTDYI